MTLDTNVQYDGSLFEILAKKLFDVLPATFLEGNFYSLLMT
jgi:hypothetical protein